jgi:putative ABC transport system ATP-binding protein
MTEISEAAQSASEPDSDSESSGPVPKLHGEVIVEAHDLEKIYKQGTIEVPALRGLDLTVHRGEFSVLAGSSGSGKTTLLNLIGALDLPTAGSLAVEGRDLAKLGGKELAQMRLRRLGFVFQAYNLIPVLTAYENAEYVLLLQGVEAAERKRRVTELLNAVGLQGLQDRRPTELSGGQQQRVAVARAIAPEPALVLADEPTANLDSKTGTELIQLMRELNQERGVTFLFSSHDPKVIDHAQRVIQLQDGRIVADSAQ